VLLEMLISKVEKMYVFVVSSSSCSCCLVVVVVVPLSGEPSALPFIGSSGGRGVPKTLRRCLRGEGTVGAMEVAVATCICECQPSLGCRSDIGDETVKDPGSCGQRTGVVPLLTDSARGRVRTQLRGSTWNG
jgi:hypothetical protein